jgi:hypothetical protein
MNATQIEFRYKANFWTAELSESGTLTVKSDNGEGQNHAVGAFYKACHMLSVFSESNTDGGRSFSHSGAFVSGPVVPAVFVVVDDENNAETFWTNFRDSLPVWAATLADTDAGESVRIPVYVWEQIQKIEGFASGPDHARTAIMIAEASE